MKNLWNVSTRNYCFSILKIPKQVVVVVHCVKLIFEVILAYLGHVLLQQVYMSVPGNLLCY